MSAKIRDPLMSAAKLLLIVFIGMLGFASVMLLIGAPFLLIFQDRVLAAMAAKGVTAGINLVYGLSVLLAALSGLLALGCWFFNLLYRLVGSVGADPFIPANADRLRTMGWISLAAQVIALPIGGLVTTIGEMAKDADAIHVGDDFGPSGEGILLMLLLFILARVFRHGTAMREDLEGTV